MEEQLNLDTTIIDEFEKDDELYNDFYKDKIEQINCNIGLIHGKIYKSIFNELPTNVIGSGFARVNGKWKYNSISFNAKCPIRSCSL